MKVAIDFQDDGQEKTSVTDASSTGEAMLHFFVNPEDFNVEPGSDVEVLDVRVIDSD